MGNEKSRRSSIERKSAGTGRRTNDRERSAGRSSDRRSSTSSVWRIDREDQGEENGKQRDAGTQDKRGSLSRTDFKRQDSERTFSSQRSDERGSSERKQYSRGEGNDRPKRRDDDARGSSERKSYDRSEGTDRPRKRDDDSRGYSERKQYGRSEGTDRLRRRDDDSRGSSERKPYGRSEGPDRPRRRDDGGRDNDRRSFSRDGGKSGFERKTYDNREDDNRKRPFERKSYGQNENPQDGERPKRTYGNSPERDGSKNRRKRMEKTHDDGLVRLNKFIANSGVCSRREADDYIIAGVVTVNGVVVNELGARVNPSDDIRFNGERLKGEKKVYILLNKPKNYVTTVEDPHADRTVMDLVSHMCDERIYPVGRLDRNSTGVLLFTNDGELTKQLTHPSYNKLKIYHVFLDKPVTQRDMRALVEGVMLEDGLAQADAVDYVGDKKTEVGLEIHSGRNRIVRRMFDALDYQVVKLDRVFFAGLTKKNLRRGECRMLSDKEVEMLKMGAYE